MSAEQSKVASYVLSKFDVTEDSADRIRLSDLASELEFFAGVDPSDKGFWARLATYLTTLGLKKKRMSDGMYYYGLRPRMTLSKLPASTSLGKIEEIRAHELEAPLHPALRFHDAVEGAPPGVDRFETCAAYEPAAREEPFKRPVNILDAMASLHSAMSSTPDLELRGEPTRCSSGEWRRKPAQ